LEAAQAQLDLLQVAPHESDIEAARAAVAAADAAYKRLLEGPSPQAIALAESRLRQAETAVKLAQAAYDQVSWNPLIASMPESLQLEQARETLAAVQAEYDALVNGAAADAVAAAYAELAAARAALRQLEEGPQPQRVRAAEAEVHRAETALFLAQLRLDKTTVRAPSAGIVAFVHASAGTAATAGTSLLTLLSLDVKISIPVGETLLPDIQPGDSASIRVDLYPDRVFAGIVTTLAPEIDPATRTFQVTVRPTNTQDAVLLVPGMVATVELAPDEP
jgi:multidrug resistance efflux pump